MNTEAAIKFLSECAMYFERRPANGEDKAHWSNVTNAENCRKITMMLEANADAVMEARQEALREYGQHKDECKTTKTYDPEDCDCGFLALFPN